MERGIWPFYFSVFNIWRTHKMEESWNNFVFTFQGLGPLACSSSELSSENTNLRAFDKLPCMGDRPKVRPRPAQDSSKSRIKFEPTIPVLASQIVRGITLQSECFSPADWGSRFLREVSYLPTSLHDVTTQNKSVILTAVSTSDLTGLMSSVFESVMQSCTIF
jgi:hypothetical protein